MSSYWLRYGAPALAGCAFLSVLTGAAVTSNEERPYYSFGQAHMWVGIAVGILTIAVAFRIQREDERSWLRRLGWSALAAVVMQGLLGWQPLPAPPAIRMAHASLAQIFFPATVVMAVCTSKAWTGEPQRIEGASWLRVMAQWAPLAVLAQVGLGVSFRHGILGVGPHLAGAFVAAIFILLLTMPVIYGLEHRPLQRAGQVFLSIAAAQVFLGLALLSMQSMDVDPALVIVMTMVHAAAGALTLAAAVMMGILIRRCITRPPLDN